MKVGSDDNDYMAILTFVQFMLVLVLMVTLYIMRRRVRMGRRKATF